MAATSSSIRVLFVDDEKFVLEAIKRTVRKTFDATFVEGGAAALDMLRSDVEPFAVMCTDMRMPGVDGLAVLEAFRAEAPDTTRVLLTGYADLDAAVAAVNQGSVFRFLTKPTDPEQLQASILEAAELFRLRHAERELLEQTLRGSVQALLETLALANPLAFARGQRIQNFVVGFLDSLSVTDRWEIEVAVMLSQVGAVTLPPEVSDRVNRGVPLDRIEQEMVAQLPTIADTLLSGIPRLETVRSIITSTMQWENSTSPLASKLLHLAGELDTYTERGLEPDVIIATLNQRAKDYGPEAMKAFIAYMESGHGAGESVVLTTVGNLRIGMRLGGDIRTRDGLLLVSRGQQVSESLLVRIRNFEHSTGLEQSTVPVLNVVATPAE